MSDYIHSCKYTEHIVDMYDTCGSVYSANIERSQKWVKN